MRRRAVWFAPTLAAARAAASGGGTVASPRAPAALVRALATGDAVVLVDPPRRDAAWERAKKRYLLPAAPGLLRDAIGGIAAHEPPPGRTSRAAGPVRAHWLPGPLTDRRAAALLAEPPVPPLWIVEDFRKLRISPATLALLERRGIRIAAYRALETARRRRRTR